MKKIIITIAIVVVALFVFAGIANGQTVLNGRIIALDAGHGGSESGAVNATYGVVEKDVNLDVVYALKDRLEADGALVVLTREGDETLPSRRERVDMAKAKCEALAGRKCDVLLSVHHNGSSDSSVDGTLVIYNEKKDIPFAEAMHDALVPLTGNDLGYLHGGYGMTVYGNMVSALTEAYFITNDSEAQAYLAGTRVDEEVDAQYTGLVNYFSSQGSGGGGKGNGKGRK